MKEMSKEELEELRKGPGVKDRFKERTEAEETVQKQWDSSELDTKGQSVHPLAINLLLN